MGNIVDSLFADYLPRRQQEPMRITDPRQQLIAPVVQRPTTAPTPRPTPARPTPSIPRYVDSRDDFLPVRIPTVAPTPTQAPAPPIEPVSRYVDPRSAFTPAPYIPPTSTTVAPPTPPADSRYVDPVGLFAPTPVVAPTPTPVAPPAPPPVSRIVDPVSAFTPTPTPTVAPTPTPRPAPVDPSTTNRFVDPRQQTMLTNQMLTPVMNKPTMPSREVPEFASVGGIGGGVVPTATEEETTESVAYDPSNFNSDALENMGIDLSRLAGLNIFEGSPLNLGLAGSQTSMSMPDYLATLPQTPSEFFNKSLDFLQNVASGDTTKKVNRRDDIYNSYFLGSTEVGGENTLPTYRFEGDPADFRAEVGLSDNFAVYDDPASMINQQTVQDAYNLLNTAENSLAALSEYYGFEIQPAINEGANYTNAAKYGTDAQRMAEFQSLVEPILQRAIPYITATQGLNYTDALEYAYTHDPMLNALYQSYGVDLYRQTKDGSTYIYDPIAGQEIRTLEVKDAKFKDYLPAIAAIGLAFTGIPTALGAALGASGTTATALGGALISGTSTLIQGGDLKDALKSAVVSGITAGVSGDLTDAVGKALGVSKEIAAGITQAGLTAAQGGNTEEALLSGFLAGASEYIRGEMPAANQDFEQFGGDVNAVNPQGFVNTATTRAATDAVTTAIAQNPAASLSEIIVTAQRINPNIAADVLASVAQQVASGAVTPGGGMLTKDTPAGELEEVTVTGRMVNLNGMEVYVASNGLMLNPQTLLPIGRQLVKGKDGVISFIDADDEILNNYGSEFAEGFQKVYGSDEWLKFLDGILAGEKYTVFGNEITYDKLFGDDPSRKVADVTQEETQPTQPEGETLPDKPTAENTEPQPDLPPEEDMEIPEFDIENLPPDFNVDMPEDVIPPELPQPITIPTPTTGGGGGSAGGIPPSIPSVTPPSTPPSAGTDSSVEEVVDVFNDGGLTGDAFEDSTVGGAEGVEGVEGAEGAEGAEGGAAEVGGDAGEADVTTTEQYKALQSELDNALATQGDLEVEVSNLQNEVAAANAAAQKAQEAAEAAEAAGAANADKLRGEAVAAQATADSLQGELAGVNAALGNANATIDSLQGQLTGTQTALGNALATVETLTGNLNTAQATANNLSSQLNTAQSELSALESEYAQAVESNSSNVKTLEGKIEAKESEISELSSELSDATSTISKLESSLADAQAATDAAVAKGIADAEAAEEAGFGEGFGEGYGEGKGLGLGAGIGLGLLSGQGGGGGGSATPATPFMQDLNTQLTRVQLSQPTQAKDYLAELLARLQA